MRESQDDDPAWSAGSSCKPLSVLIALLATLTRTLAGLPALLLSRLLAAALLLAALAGLGIVLLLLAGALVRILVLGIHKGNLLKSWRTRWRAPQESTRIAEESCSAKQRICRKPCRNCIAKSS
jgi:hypothetical protein